MSVTDLSSYMLIAIIAMSISMLLIPLMIRLAPVIGMVDKPDERKIHAEIIPRVGGVGIVVGLMVPIIMWSSQNPFTESLLLGCVVLLVFGSLDDIKELGPIVKFAGQFIAAAIVVYYGDVYVFHFPFMGQDELPGFIAKPFTVIAIVGMINALNLSDGLDGLAGGEALLSLAGMAYMAYQYDGSQLLIVIIATIGGIFGFLRFNSHPARVFMGDSGSQTLGFILGSSVVYLSQNLNPLISSAVPLLLLGLPVVDSLVVFTQRARRGNSLVTAAKDHLHHRLLDLNFYHYESVVIIYSVQVVLVVCAILLPYESDVLIVSIYLSICLLVFMLVTFSEKVGWRAHSRARGTPILYFGILKKHDYLVMAPYRVLKAGLSLFILSAAVMSTEVPADLGVSSLILLIAVIASKWFGDNLYRLVMYITIAFAVYLSSTYPPDWLLEQISLSYVFFATMTIMSFVVARTLIEQQFQVTTLDYLVVIIVIIVSMMPGVDHGSSSIVWMVVQIIILFYACELVIQNTKNHLNSFTGFTGLALALIAYRGLV